MAENVIEDRLHYRSENQDASFRKLNVKSHSNVSLVIIMDE